MAAIRIENELIEYRAIKKGVRQGCVVPPDLFNLYSEMIMRNFNEHEGVKLGGNNVSNLWYADDTLLIADSEEKLQTHLTTAAVKSIEKGIQLNSKKTECMVISNEANILICNISCDDEKIKQVKILKYQGYTITQN